MNSESSPLSISNFMKSPLVSWAKTFQDEEKKALEFKCLCDGVFLYNMWLEIDPHPPYHGINLSTDDVAARIRNLDVLIHNIKAFYEEVLGQLLLIRVPDILTLAKRTDDHLSTGEMESLLLLILGCAVQCERKEHFIEIIKSMDLEVQHKIVDYIQQITDNPEAVWTNEWNELSLIPSEEQEHMYSLLIQHLRRLVRERDELAQKTVSFALQNISLSSGNNLLSPASTSSFDKSHLIVELADVKARLRKLQQEVEEKNEGITELKEELELSKDAHSKLRQENLELIQDARTAKTYRDEIDILKERVRKVDRLESEIQRYKDKMNELEFYKSRVEELREDNRILVETKTMLEDQLEASRKRAELVVELEAEILKYCSQINELTIEREADRERIQQLLEENTQLHIDRKASMEELAQLQNELSQTFRQCSPLENHSLMDQLNTDAQTRVFQLELENQRLRILVDSLNRSPSFEMTDVEGNQSVQKYMDSLDRNIWLDKGNGNVTSVLIIQRENEALKDKVSSLEKAVEELQSVIKKLSPFETQCLELEKQLEEMKQTLNSQKADFSKYEQMEHNIISLNTENQKLQRLVETSQQKINELQQDLQSVENENQKLNNNMDSLKMAIHKYHDLERETTNLETINHRLEQEMKGFEKENNRLKVAIETKDATIEEYSSRISWLDRENKQLQKQVENLSQIATKVRDLERENKDLSQQTAVDKKSLEVLRQDLVSEKIANQKLSNEINKVKRMKECSEAVSEIFYHDREKQPNELKAADKFLSETESKKAKDVPIVPKNNCEYKKADYHQALMKEIDTYLENSEKHDDTFKEENVKKEETSLFKLYEEVNRLKSVVVELEEKKQITAEENYNLSNQATNLRDENGNLKSKLETVKHDLSVAAAQNNNLQSRLAELEVEIKEADSKNTTLTSQNSKFQVQVSSLEEQNKQIHQQLSELDSRHRSLMGDHESLQRLHEQLTNDYEALIKNHSSLKSIHKSLKVEHNNLKVLCKEQMQAALFSQEEVMKLKEVLEEDTSKTSVRMLSNLRSEHIQLKDQLKSVKEAHDAVTRELKSLQMTHKALKSENNELKLKYTAMQGELLDCQNETSSLDVEVSKLTSCCELLSQKNTLLEEEQQSLMSHISILLGQYHELLFQVVSENGQLRKENSFREKLRELCQQKEKLEQKIVEHCHKLQQKSPKRKQLQSSGSLRMRRTRSAFLRNMKQNDQLSSHSDNSTDSSLYCSLRRPKKPTSWSHSRKSGITTNADDSCQEDHIPVRDVGLGGFPEGSVESNPSVVQNQKLEKNVPEVQQKSEPQLTTLENNMTLNLITNLTNPDTFSSHPFSRSKSSQQISPYYMNNSGPNEFLFNPLPLTQGSTNPYHGFQNLPKLGHSTSSVHSDCGSNPDSSEASKYTKTHQVEKDCDQNAVPNITKDKCPENSIWYEYGCV